MVASPVGTREMQVLPHTSAFDETEGIYIFPYAREYFVVGKTSQAGVAICEAQTGAVVLRMERKDAWVRTENLVLKDREGSTLYSVTKSGTSTRARVFVTDGESRAVMTVRKKERMKKSASLLCFRGGIEDGAKAYMCVEGNFAGNAFTAAWSGGDKDGIAAASMRRGGAVGGAPGREDASVMRVAPGCDAALMSALVVLVCELF